MKGTAICREVRTCTAWRHPSAAAIRPTSATSSSDTTCEVRSNLLRPAQPVARRTSSNAAPRAPRPAAPTARKAAEPAAGPVRRASVNRDRVVPSSCPRRGGSRNFVRPFDWRDGLPAPARRNGRVQRRSVCHERLNRGRLDGDRLRCDWLGRPDANRQTRQTRNPNDHQQ